MAATLVVPGAVFAQDTAERTAAIKSNCQLVKTALQAAQRRDLVARTNRGRAYEAVLKQMEAFSQRIRNNKLQTVPFDATISQFKEDTANFREAYERYDNHLNTLQDIDCRQKPDDFSRTLEESRVLRAETAAALARTDAALDQYRANITTLLQQLSPSAGAANE